MASNTWTWIGTSGDPTLFTNWSPNGHPQPGDTAIVPGGTTVPPNYAETSLSDITFDLAGNGTLAFSNPTTTAGASEIDALSVIDATGTATELSLAGPFTNLGTIEITGTQAGLTIQLAADGAGSASLVNQGQIVVDQGDTLAIADGTIFDSGAVLVNGGIATISGTLVGLDNFGVGTGGTLELGHAASGALADITFTGTPGTGTTGLVKLDAPATFVGTINGFASGDTIDLGPVNVSTVVFDGEGDIIAVGTAGTVFNANLPGFEHTGTFVLSGTGGLAGYLQVTEGSGDTTLTVLPPSTWLWQNGASAPGNTVSDWSVVSGPGNGWGYPQTGDTAIDAGGTIVLVDPGFTDITLELGGTVGVAALSTAGSGNTNLDNPSLDSASLLTSDVAGNTTPETSLLNAAGSFINDGTIDANGPAGSGFTIAISDTTLSGTYQPGNFIDNNLLRADAGNAMTITVAGTAASLGIGQAGTGALDVENGGTVVVDLGLTAGGGVVDEAPSGGTGVVSVAAGGTLTASGITLGYGLFELASGDGTLIVSGAGAVVNDSGDVTVGDGGSGTLEISNGGMFSTGSDAGIAIDPVTPAEGHVLYGDGLVTVTDGTLNTGSLQVGLMESEPDIGEVYTSGVLMIGQGGVVNVGSIAIANAVTMAGGTLDSTAAIMGTVVSGIGFGNIDGYGTIIAPTLDIGVDASGGTLEFTGSTLLGTSAIEGGAALQIDQAGGSGAAVMFAASSTAAALILGAPQAVDSLAIENWQNSDSVVFDNGVTVTGAAWVGGTLDVFTSGGTYDFNNVTLAAGTTPIFSTGADFVELISCFAAGTRIATPDGMQRVEDLAAGDRVRTVLSGKSQPIVWIGRRTIDCTRHPKPWQVWPVRVAAGAFGRGQPTHNLYLSPDHAVHVDGVLIPVKYLVNEATIVQVPCDSVTYHHLELPRHDVVLAEGLPAETYLDTGDRWNFANGGLPIAMFPDFASRVWEAKGCAELIIIGPKLDSVRARLASGVGVCVGKRDFNTEAEREPRWATEV